MGTETTQKETWSRGPTSLIALLTFGILATGLWGLSLQKEISDLDALRFSYKVVWQEGSIIFEGPGPNEAMIENVVIEPYFGRGNIPMESGDPIPLTRDTVSQTADGRYLQIESIDDVVCKASIYNDELCKSRGLSEILVTFEVYGTRDTDRVEVEKSNSRS